MAIIPTVYDWPTSIAPRDQLFRVVGQAKQGGFTVGGANIMQPEIGGRSTLEWSFNPLWTSAAATMYSWLASKVGTGAVFRLPVWCSRQGVSASSIGVTSPSGGVLPWDGDLLWSSGVGWSFEPGATVVSGALEGETTISVDIGAMSPGLTYGHVIGHHGRAYVVDDIEYSGSVATITLAPPLRANAEVGDFITFRPTMYGVCINPDAFKPMMSLRKWATPGNAIFAEVLF